MLGNILLRGLHEPGNQHHEAIRAFGLGPLAQADGVACRVAAAARIHGYTFGARLDAKRDNLLALLIGQANKFATTPAGAEAMHPRIDQPLDMPSRCRYIDPIVGHDRHGWSKNTTDHKALRL